MDLINVMYVKRFKCERCYWTFLLDDMQGIGNPIYCPHCGYAWEVNRTLAEIVEQIEILLNELKEMAEAPKGTSNLIDRK